MNVPRNANVLRIIRTAYSLKLAKLCCFLPECELGELFWSAMMCTAPCYCTPCTYLSISFQRLLNNHETRITRTDHSQGHEYIREAPDHSLNQSFVTESSMHHDSCITIKMHFYSVKMENYLKESVEFLIMRLIPVNINRFHLYYIFSK